MINVQGTVLSDFILHFFCPCCAAAQEARESIFLNGKILDFWYGEELQSINFPQVQRDGYVPSSPNVASTEEGNDVGLIERLKSVSQFSVLIIRMWTVFILSIFLALLITGKGLSIVVLLLVFLQSAIILYFVYWRDPEKNKHVSLDYVVKMFAVGFFMSTSQSIVFESILEGILGMVMGTILVILNPGMNDSNDDNNNSSSDQAAELTAALLPYFRKEASWGTLFNAAFSNTYAFISNNTPTSDSFYVPEHDVSFQPTHADGNTYFPLATPVLTSSNGTDSGFTPELMRKNFFLVIIALFVMAFVIAAGVEETMKHFAVRCCRFPAPLQDPKSALIYLMTAALGFATSENIEYVFGATK